MKQTLIVLVIGLFVLAGCCGNVCKEKCSEEKCTASGESCSGGSCKEKAACCGSSSCKEKAAACNALPGEYCDMADRCSDCAKINASGTGWCRACGVGWVEGKKVTSKSKFDRLTSEK